VAYRHRPRGRGFSSSEEDSDSDGSYDGYRSNRDYQDRRDKPQYKEAYRHPERPQYFQRGRYERGPYNYRQEDDFERNIQDHRKYDNPRYSQDNEVGATASELVEALSKCPNWKETLLNLLEKEEMKPSEVRKIANQYPSVFHLDGEVLELKPQISLCEEHMQDGCRSRNECRKLHICDKYITGDCQSRACLMGHKWDTNHNIKVLKEYNLNNLPQSTLAKLIHDITRPSQPDGPLEICLNFNKKGCRNIPCERLHLCLSLVKNKNICKKKNCKLNHDVLDMSCLNLLTAYGISVNESPRDILDSILRMNPSIINLRDIDDESKGKKKKDKASSPVTIVLESDCDDASDMMDNSSDSDTINKGKKSSKDSLKRKNKTEKDLGTVWFDFSNGDVNNPEICYYSVESLCKNEATGCDRLHSTHHFHWQISERGDSWYNLTIPLIKCLELSYCNPEEEDATLERLNPQSLDRSSRNLLLLMGRDKWQADFNTMTMSNSSKSKVLKLRRLCTQNITGQDIDENKFNWYFKDKNQKWIVYGDIDSTGEEKLKSNISSKDIENAFKQDFEKPLSFKNSSFNYSLDFINMKQTNTQTNVAREVRRRPKPHLSENDDGQSKTSNVNLPSTWEPMQPTDRVRKVNVQPSTSEYKAVVNLFTGNYTITKIERIQNPFHYRAFANKVQDMIAVYNNDSSKADVRQLFHGTKSAVIKSICSENFDWRLHGTSTGNVYGRGTYFSPDVKLSYGYCQPDPSSGSKYMFIAKVAVGTMIVGDSSMARPPINNATSMPYDTTVNNMSNPTIIVKYDKQEYYPEYIVTLN
ncbi:unnamed protein product, partial [Meganyctiphanes norvegica]